MSRPIPRASCTNAVRAGRDSPGPRAARFFPRIAVSFALCWLLASCAVQGPPLPPRVERPEAVKALSVVQEGRAFELAFTPPARATDGERLTKPLDIEIYVSRAPRGAAPAPLSGLGAPTAVLKPADLARLTAGGSLVYSWELSRKDYAGSLGSNCAFAVRGVTYGRRHGRLEGELSPVARGTLLDVSGPVENLRVRTTQNSLNLDWSAPARSLSGAPPSTLADYHVYRSDSGKPGSFESRGVVTSPSFSDRDFVFAHTYFYKVQAEFHGDHSTAESADSAPVEITPRDVFPPAAPRDVTAIYASGAVEVVWSPSPEPDLAGYNVFRREANGTETKTNTELLRTPVFRDPHVEPGRRYSYRVTAVDFAGNSSPMSEAAEVETR